MTSQAATTGPALFALLVAPGEYEGTSNIQHTQAAEMHLVGDRPWLQRVIENVVEGGVTSLEVLVCHGSDRIGQHFGNGERWGCQIRFSLVQEPSLPYRILRARDLSGLPDWLWIVHAQWLSHEPLPAVESGQATLLVDSQGNWAGAAWVPRSVVAELFQLPIAEVGPHLLRSVKQANLSGRETLQLDHPAAVLKANRVFLTQKGWDRFGREVEPGLWIGRDVVLHPTVELIEPVYIAPHCRLGEGVRLGPNVVLGSNVVVDRATTIEDSVVAVGSYLGNGLEIREAIVDNQRILLAEADFELFVNDPVLLSSTQVQGEVVWHILSRALAVWLWVCLFPLWFLQRSWHGKSLEAQVVRQPCSTDSGQWVSQLAPYSIGPWRNYRDHFWNSFLPGLSLAIKGDIRLVGMPPRTAEQLSLLDTDHLRCVIQMPVGLISEALVQFGPRPDADQQRVCDGFFAATRSGWHDLSLLFSYLTKVLSPQPTLTVDEDAE